jgi:hypothetical protein
MSNELTIAAERGQSMAELMGVSTSGGEATPSIARIGMLHSPIMGEIEVGGKMIKTEVVSVGSFIMTKGEDKVYSNGVNVRIFAQRQQWQRWNDETGEMEKSVQANTLSGDLKDSIGGLNLGRPSGYIEDWNSVPDDTKAIIRSVKKVNIYYGTITLCEPVNEKGEALPLEDYVNIPFVMDIKNRESIKSINGVLNSLQRKNMLPIMSTVFLDGVEGTIASGAKFGYIKAQTGEKVDIAEGDNDMLKDFIELIEYSNGKILDLHHERSNKAMSPADDAMVSDIINNDFVDVD